MAYRYRSRRSVKRLTRKGRRNLIITLILVALLLYATFTWILPFFITGVGFLTSKLRPVSKISTQTFENTNLAPPVLNIPYEATKSAQIDIKGYATPNSRVKLYIDDQPEETVDVSQDGSFVIENVSLSLGTNNIYGKTLDEKDRESLPSKNIKVIYDDEKPLLEISEPEDGKTVTGDRKVKVLGKTEIGAQVFINDNQVIVVKDGNFSFDQPLNDGDNIITIKAQDSASNTTEIQRKVTFTP